MFTVDLISLQYTNKNSLFTYHIKKTKKFPKIDIT